MYTKFEELIKSKGITIYRVAKDTGICSVNLYNWKSGKSVPKLDKLSKIAKYLGVSVSELIEEDK